MLATATATVSRRLESEDQESAISAILKGSRGLHPARLNIQPTKAESEALAKAEADIAKAREEVDALSVNVLVGEKRALRVECAKPGADPAKIDRLSKLIGDPVGARDELRVRRSMAKARLKAIVANVGGVTLDVLKRAEKTGMEALRAHVEGTRKTAEAMSLQWEPDFVCKGLADAIHASRSTAEEIRAGRENRGPSAVLKNFLNS